MRINIDTYNLGYPEKNEKIKFMVVQPQLQLGNDDDGVKLNEPSSFIKSMLNVAKDEDIDLLVFPEYSIPLDDHKQLLEWSQNNDCVIIAGTDIIENYNTSMTFYKGRKYKTKKIYPSPKETPKQINAGDTIYMFKNSPIGSFVILICNDINSPEVKDAIKKQCLNIDLLIVLAMHDKPSEHYAFINELVLSSKNTKNPVYVIYSNAYQASDKGGGSAIFANEYQEIIEEAKNNGDIPRESELHCLRFLLKKDYKYYIAEGKSDKILSDRNPDPDRGKINILHVDIESKSNDDTKHNNIGYNDTGDVLLQKLKSFVKEDNDRYNDFEKFYSLSDQYSELFSYFINCDRLDKKNNIFEATYEIIIRENKENNNLPIKIIGNPGTGKSKFLSILYHYLENKTQDNNQKYIPFLLNLHHYVKMDTSKLKNEISDIFQTISDVCKEFPDSYIIFIIDSIENQAYYAPGLIDSIAENLKNTKNHRRLVCIGDLTSRDIAKLPKTLKDVPDVVYSFNVIDPDNYNKVANVYSQIYEINANDFIDILTKNDVINEIDFCLLTFFRDFLKYGRNNNSSFSLADVLLYYCNETLKDDKLLLNMAEKAFIAEKASKDTDNLSVELNYDEWCFINKSTNLKNYLLAYYYSQCLLKPELWNDEIFFKTSSGNGVTYLIKSIICTGIFEEEEKYYTTIKKLYLKYPKSYSANKLLCFLMGRFKSTQVKKDAMSFLKEQKSKINSSIKRKDNEEKVKRDLELLLRTIYISLIYLGHRGENNEYIDLLLGDIEKSEHNKFFHLQYYGNIQHAVLEVKNLNDEEIKKALNQTFSVLERKINKHLEGKEDPLFEVDLFTICSIIQIRSQNDQLPIEYINKGKDIVGKVLKSSYIKNKKLKIYLTMLEEDLSTGDGFKNNCLFEKADKLSALGRTGWIKNGIPDPENVVEHTYSCWLIGLLYLPTDRPTNEKKYHDYKKSDILEMLLIHDLAEVYTGDIISDEKTADDEHNEDMVMQNIFMHDTYNLKICGASVNYSRYKKLWENFFKGNNINAEIALDIDKIQAKYKYNFYKYKKKYKFLPEREALWEKEIELSTDIGREIWKILKAT